jgi:6,7-dimethyl-8-ribityllumazine synthase
MSNKILILNANFYQHISDLIIAGVSQKLVENKFEPEVMNVAGALELPAAAQYALESNKYAGIVAAGCVIRGGTTHYDTVCHFAFHGLQQLSLGYKTPITYAILTVENESQAIERADPKGVNKGGQAAQACIDLIKIKYEFKQ